MKDRGIEIDDTTPVLDKDTEERFRALIADVCEVFSSADWRKHGDLVKGMVLGAHAILEAQGYGDWATSVIVEEMETFSRNLKGNGGFFGHLASKSFDARMRRIIVPGNRFTSAING